MKLFKKLTSLALASLLAGGGLVASAAAASATPNATQSSSVSTSNGFTVVGPTGELRTIAPDEFNTTSYPGLSATMSLAPTDQVLLANEDRMLLIKDASGIVLLSSVNPVLGDALNPIEAKFVVVGDKLVVTPADAQLSQQRPTSRAACASAFWGNLIFNVGMYAVCAMLGIGTGGVGALPCSMAVIGANLGINWDKPCK
ncbi:hypothetical protein [Leucobacter chromiireducens]|uniref:hypothetical protein n=1 Tax=Leucobacter chromiireducens TaxID=283877 RepID=UPI003F81E86F